MNEKEHREFVRLIRRVLVYSQLWTPHEARRMEQLESRATRDEVKRAWKEAK